MRRADRLFQIIQIFQRQRSVITADRIAEELEVSTRTIYRDIADLIGSKVPIRGEAGTGYLLERGFDMPPMMFSEEEIDAIMLGVQWVRANGDPAIQRAAEDVLTKVESILPENRQELMQYARHVIPVPEENTTIGVSMPVVRQCIRSYIKARTVYRTPSGDQTSRIICPLVIVFFGNIQLLVAWCELRKDFRNFRMDRFEVFDKLDSRFSRASFDGLEAYMKKQKSKHS